MTVLQRIRSVKTASEILATWVTISGALGAGLITLYEYHTKARGERVTETLRYEEKFQSSPLLDTRARLDGFWTGQFPEMSAAGKESQEQLSSFIIQSITSDKRVQADTVALLNFFDGLKACICADICDSKLSMRLLGKDASDLYGLNYPYIMSQRRQLNDESYGLGLTAIATAYIRKKPLAENSCVAWP
jgi:hypothetical protein